MVTLVQCSPLSRTGRLAERMAEQPATVPDPSKAITLRPLKSVGNLQERYSEATADVVFVGKERLPAHRAILSVASAVFFKMFDGIGRRAGRRTFQHQLSTAGRLSRQQSLFCME